MLHSRVVTALVALLVAIISGAFWALTQLLPVPTNIVVNQTLTRLGISDLALVYQVITAVFIVSLVIIAAIVALILLDRRKGHDDTGKVMMAQLKRMGDERLRDKVRDFFAERNQTASSPSSASEMPILGPLQKATLTIWVSSTADWFEVGIENGKLIDIASWRIGEGSVDVVAPFPNYFHVNHVKSKSLNIGIKANFNLPRKNAICVLRKSDMGRIRVRVLTGLLSIDVGNYVLSRSPNAKNQVTFQLAKM